MGKFEVVACVAPAGARPAQWARLKTQPFTTDKAGMAALKKWLRAAR